MISLTVLALVLVSVAFILWAALSRAFSRLVTSSKAVARQKKLLDLPSSKFSIIVSSNPIRFLCCSIKASMPCSLMKFRLDMSLLYGG